MNETIMQAGIWICAGGAMILLLKRRRSRKGAR